MLQNNTMDSKLRYRCNTCPKTYTHKYNYDRHIACCEFFQKTLVQHEHDMEYREPPPDMHGLYQLVKELAVRVMKVEKENTQLKQCLMKRTKINIVDWLNQQHTDKQPSQHFAEWFKTVVLTKVHSNLDCVYTHDLVSGIVSTWETAVTIIDGEPPIKAFEMRTNTFYIYDIVDDKPVWSVMSNESLDMHIKHICKQFLVDFKHYWYDENESKIKEDEKWTNMYVNYYQKILGGSRYTTDGICQKARQQLYKILKQTFTQPIEVDFT